MTKDDALAAMIRSIQGAPYSADGLSVDASATPNLRTTDEGFTCEAFFPAGLLADEIISRKTCLPRKTLNGDLVTDLIAVQLDVHLQDVWAIAEFIGGVQHNL